MASAVRARATWPLGISFPWLPALAAPCVKYSAAPQCCSMLQVGAEEEERPPATHPLRAPRPTPMPAAPPGQTAPQRGRVHWPRRGRRRPRRGAKARSQGWPARLPQSERRSRHRRTARCIQLFPCTQAIARRSSLAWRLETSGLAKRAAAQRRGSNVRVVLMQLLARQAVALQPRAGMCPVGGLFSWLHAQQQWLLHHASRMPMPSGGIVCWQAGEWLRGRTGRRASVSVHCRRARESAHLCALSSRTIVPQHCCLRGCCGP